MKICLRTFLGMFSVITQNFWGHSPECLAISPLMFEVIWSSSGIFEDIPWNACDNIWGHSPECLAVFPIPCNVWRHSLKSLRTFPRMFGDIHRSSPYSLHSPHSVPRSCIPGFIPKTLYRVPCVCYGETFHAFLKTRLVGTGALLF